MNDYPKILPHELYQGLIEYFEGMADADQPAGAASPIPNEEMRFLLKLEECCELNARTI